MADSVSAANGQQVNGSTAQTSEGGPTAEQEAQFFELLQLDLAYTALSEDADSDRKFEEMRNEDQSNNGTA